MYIQYIYVDVNEQVQILKKNFLKHIDSYCIIQPKLLPKIFFRININSVFQKAYNF
jgi:hypothetical protein